MSDTDINVSGISSADRQRRSGHVFISYKSQQDEEAKRLQQYIEGKGFPCWRAPGSLHKRGTQDYSNDIFKAIRESNCLLFVLSDAALGSDWVQREVNYALNTCHKPVIPFVIDQIPVAKKESNGVYISLQLEKQILNEDLSWKMDVILPYLESAFGGDGADAEAAKEKKEIPLRSCSQSEWRLWQEKAKFHLTRLNELATMNILWPGKADLTPEARELEMRLSANEAADSLFNILVSVPKDANEWGKREEDSIRRKATKDFAKLTYDHGKRFSPFVYSNALPFAESGVPWANFVMHSKSYLGQDILSTTDDDDSNAKFFSYLQKAVLDEENPWAALRIGECWQWGTGCDVSGTQARFWYEKADRLGCGEALFCLARLFYFAPAGIKQDYGKALDYAERGEKAGDAASANLAGEIKFDQYLVNRDKNLLKDAEKHFVFAYDNGSSRALVNIARLHWEEDYSFEDKRFAISEKDDEQKARRKRLNNFKTICWAMKRAGIRDASLLLARNELFETDGMLEAAIAYAVGGCRDRDWNSMDAYAGILVHNECMALASRIALDSEPNWNGEWNPILEWLEGKVQDVEHSSLSSYMRLFRDKTASPPQDWDWNKSVEYPKTRFWEVLTTTDCMVSNAKRNEILPIGEFLSALRNIPTSDKHGDLSIMKEVWELVRLLDWELETFKAVKDGTADIFPPEFYDDSFIRRKKIVEILLSRMNDIPDASLSYRKIQKRLDDYSAENEFPHAEVAADFEALREKLRTYATNDNGAISPAVRVGAMLGEVERRVSPPVFAAAMTLCRKAFNALSGSYIAVHFAHLFLTLNARHFDQNRNEGMLFSLRDILFKGILLGELECAPLYIELCLLGMKIGNSQLQADFGLIEKVEPYLLERVSHANDASTSHFEIASFQEVAPMSKIAFAMAKIYLDDKLFHMSRTESWGHVSLRDKAKGVSWLHIAKRLAKVANEGTVFRLAKAQLGRLKETMGADLISVFEDNDSDYLDEDASLVQIFDAEETKPMTSKNAAIQALANQLPPDVDAMAFKHVALDGLILDLAVSSDDVAVLFAVYPEDEDYVACPREDQADASETMEGAIPATKMDLLVRQCEALQKLEADAELHIAIIASTRTLASMRDVWGDELEEKQIELVEYSDFEDLLRKYLPEKTEPDDEEKSDAEKEANDEDGVAD